MLTSKITSKSSTLSDTLQRQLNSYALAATAAGVGVLALVPPADAKIIYTPAHKQITPKHTIPLDLNHDGKTDFSIHATFTCTSFCEYIVGSITVIPARDGDRAIGFAGRSHHYASALAAGARVGPKGPFLTGGEVMAFGGYDAGTTSIGYCSGPWKNVQKRYLGLKFLAAGRTHYGWARLNETCGKNGENTALLTGYAYETTPNKPIIAGKTKGALEPGSLGVLAAGASQKRK
jgi:hypothetical protein